MSTKQGYWGEDEFDTLLLMVSRGEDPTAIAKALGRSRQSILSKMYAEGMSQNRSTGGKGEVEAVKHLVAPRPVYTSLTAAMMGDPPLGRSALDQRGGAA